MNNFETLRKFIWGHHGYDNARAALDRIEAEVERLRAENDALGKMVELNVTALNKALDEAERLRAALERIADRDFGINKGERYRSEYARAALAKEES